MSAPAGSWVNPDRIPSGDTRAGPAVGDTGTAMVFTSCQVTSPGGAPVNPDGAVIVVPVGSAAATAGGGGAVVWPVISHPNARAPAAAAAVMMIVFAFMAWLLLGW